MKIKIGNKFVIVDKDDVERVKSVRWCMSDHRGYCISDKGDKRTYLHRFIMNAPEGSIVDHKNGNVLDNRRANLRFCTKSQNAINHQKLSSSNTSGFHGVSMRKRTPSLKKPWLSQISLNGEYHFLGYHKTKEEAAVAYDNAAKCFFGEFAALNFT